MLSDVIGDPLDLIVSGPTTPDDYAIDSTTDSTNDGGANDTWTHVWKLIESYNALQTTLPPNVLQYLEKGKRGELPDLPKQSHPTFQNSHTVLVGNNDFAVKAAAQKAEMLGYHPIILSISMDKAIDKAMDKAMDKVKHNLLPICLFPWHTIYKLKRQKRTNG